MIMKKNANRKVTLVDKDISARKGRNVKGGPIYMSPAALNFFKYDGAVGGGALNFKK